MISPYIICSIFLFFLSDWITCDSILNSEHEKKREYISFFLYDLKISGSPITTKNGVPIWMHKIPKSIAEKRENKKNRISLIDIGLYDAQETIAAAFAGYEVYAFEPVFSAVQKIEKRLHDLNVPVFVFYNYDKNNETLKEWTNNEIIKERETLRQKSNSTSVGHVLLFQFAVGAKKEKLTINLPKLGQASSFVDKITQNSPKQPVTVLTLDSLLNVFVDNNESPFLIKIDTQGFDLFVLQGASNLLQKTHMVIVEFWPRGLNDANVSGVQMLNFLAFTVNYKCFEMDGSDAKAPSSNFSQYTQWYLDNPVTERWGRYGDLVCVNKNTNYI